MAWPPPTLTTTRTDTTVMASTHPADHNAANLAINDTVARVIALGGGVLGYASVIAPENGFGATAADIASLTRTWTAVANHYYRVTVKAHRLTQNTTNGLVILQVTDAANAISAEAVQLVTGGSDVTMETIAIVGPAGAGSVTRKARLRTTAGTVNVAASGTSPCFILVEDLGLLV